MKIPTRENLESQPTEFLIMELCVTRSEEVMKAILEILEDRDTDSVNTKN